MKIGLFGHGKMGRAVAQEAEQLNWSVVSVEEAEVCIDFSHASAVPNHIEWAVAHRIDLVIGTTGWEGEMGWAKEQVGQNIGVIASPNFSFGVALFIQLLKEARALFAEYDLAGIEYHHKEKKDAPSGTAIEMARALKMTSPFSSVRCGRVPGKHLLIFDSPCDSITLQHEAHNRVGFAQGALKAASWIYGKKGWWTVEEMLRDIYGARYPIHREGQPRS